MKKPKSICNTIPVGNPVKSGFPILREWLSKITGFKILSNIIMDDS